MKVVGDAATKALQAHFKEQAGRFDDIKGVGSATSATMLAFIPENWAA